MLVFRVNFMKKRMLNKLYNSNGENKGCWVHTDSNGNILRKEVNSNLS